MQGSQLQPGLLNPGFVPSEFLWLPRLFHFACTPACCRVVVLRRSFACSQPSAPERFSAWPRGSDSFRGALGGQRLELVGQSSDCYAGSCCRRVPERKLWAILTISAFRAHSTSCRANEGSKTESRNERGKAMSCLHLFNTSLASGSRGDCSSLSTLKCPDSQTERAEVGVSCSRARARRRSSAVLESPATPAAKQEHGIGNPATDSQLDELAANVFNADAWVDGIFAPRSAQLSSDGRTARPQLHIIGLHMGLDAFWKKGPLILQQACSVLRADTWSCGI